MISESVIFPTMGELYHFVRKVKSTCYVFLVLNSYQLSSIINVNFNEKYKKITEEIINEDFREPVQKKLILN